MSEVLENTIYVSEKAKAKVKQLMQDAGVTDDPNYFLRVLA
jgi:iron-sulfur cluster assembly protein